MPPEPHEVVGGVILIAIGILIVFCKCLSM